MKGGPNIWGWSEKPNQDQIKPYIKNSDEGDYVLASMGIYIYKKSVLNKTLEFDGNDFGKNIIPATMKKHKTFAYKYGGTCKDIGTIRAYYDANVALPILFLILIFTIPNIGYIHTQDFYWVQK